AAQDPEEGRPGPGGRPPRTRRMAAPSPEDGRPEPGGWPPRTRRKVAPSQEDGPPGFGPPSPCLNVQPQAFCPLCRTLRCPLRPSAANLVNPPSLVF
ncbi:MAG: hypothetical protein LBT40_05815, partial [Deltaproteobacteria bacterium]|nr:hypothetical protein [Deltaproteobacteria bacterium]